MADKDWTIMVYMAGDNNLSDDMAFSLSDLQTFTNGLTDINSNRVNLLAFFDSNSLTAPTSFYDFSEPGEKRFPVTAEDIYHNSSNPTQPPGRGVRDGNSASAYSVMNFVRWCIHTRGKTAKNYALIFSGHSFGFHGSSFMRDESSGAYMTIFKFRWTLEQIIKEYLGPEKISILGFDSCVMSMLEVGYELKGVAQTIVASEGSIPNSGWAYYPMFKQLVDAFCEANRGPLSAQEAACRLVDGFINKQKEYAIGGRSVDLAAWDLQLIDPIARAVSDLASELLNKLNLPRLKKLNNKITKKDVFIFEQLKNAILQSHIYSQTYMAEQCVDLKDFCHRLAVECRSLEEQMRLVGFDCSSFGNIKKLCGDVIRAVNRCVLKSGYCGDAFQYSNGISIYFPWTALAFNETQYRYRYLRFNKGEGELFKDVGIGSKWNDFLFYYLYVATLRKKRGNDKIDIKIQFDELINSELAGENWAPETKENWAEATRDNWRLGTRDNWRLGTRDNWRLGTRGEMASYLETFGGFKNYQLGWDLHNFSDAEEFDENKLTAGYFDIADED